MTLIIPVAGANGFGQIRFEKLCDCRTTKYNISRRMGYLFRGISCAECFRWYSPTPDHLDAVLGALESIVGRNVAVRNGGKTEAT